MASDCSSNIDLNKINDENNNDELETLDNFEGDEEKIIKNDSNNSNPTKIQFCKDLIKKTCIFGHFDDLFCVFNSIYDILFLVYININNSIIFYNLNDDKIVNEIRKAHNEKINNIKYFIDKINKRDLMLSVSSLDRNIKLWNINDFQCLYDYKNVYNDGYLYSVCFLKKDDLTFIAASKNNFPGDSENIKIFDLNGNKIIEIKESNDNTIFIDSYYDIQNSKNYIITGNCGLVKSYDFNENKLYHIYQEIDDISFSSSLIINNKEGVLKLIESSTLGSVRIWDFHSGVLLNKIKGNYCLYGICLWNNNYLLVGCEDRTIKILDFKKGKIIKSLNGHQDYVMSIKKINHPKYGICIISQGYPSGQIKLWVYKDY